MKKDFEILFPTEIEELTRINLPDPLLLEYYKRLENREIFWNDIIDENTMDISMYILKWNAEDKGKPIEERTPIKIWINSDGGDLDTVMNITSLIKLSKTPVITIGMGKCYSSGGILLMAGHKRYIFDTTTCLIHDGSTGMGGAVGKVMDSFEFTKKVEETVKQYIMARTKITPKMYDSNYRKDWFIFADEMIKLSIADIIITDIDEII